jgi:hypothetical protein
MQVVDIVSSIHFYTGNRHIISPISTASPSGVYTSSPDIAIAILFFLAHSNQVMQRSYRSKFLKSRLKIILLVLLATTTIALTVIARPVAHLTLTAWSDRDDRQPLLPGTIDDASHLNQTQVTIKQVKSQSGITEVILQSVLRDALRQDQKVAIAGSRHTMGGHTLYAKGISLDMLHFNRMQLNPATKILTVQSGAKWSEIIPYLNERGYSVAVMQSNNDFSVGGTMSANAHGWQHNSPPFASTVEGFRLMLASGKVVECSRQENSELFSLVLGGYGLFGIILDVNLRVVPNETYIAERFVIKSENYIDTYRQRVDVTTCNTNRSNLQSRHFQTRINCNYNYASARINCN